MKRFPRFPIPHHFLFISRHFGTGVLIATAFVHLFPTAYTSLIDPCLPSFWNKGYPAMPGLIAMTSVFMVVGIEMYFATKGAGHVHGSEYDNFAVDGEEDVELEGRNSLASVVRPAGTRQLSVGSRMKALPNITVPDYHDSTKHLMAGQSPSVGVPSPLPGGRAATSKPFFDAEDPTQHDGDRDSDLDIDPDELHDTLDAANDSGASSTLLNGTASHKHHHAISPPASPRRRRRRTLSNASQPLSAAAQQRALLQCLLLEAGILFHSIFIGMALSVSTGPPFVVLLIAISFHQTFEGLALGSRISALYFAPHSPQPWLMALAYGTTTPLGQALGLALHSLYDPASQTGLLVVGITNAVSSGLLLFAGLVELLAEDFLSEASYRALKGRRRLEASAAVVAGALLMALVGAWA